MILCIYLTPAEGGKYNLGKVIHLAAVEEFGLIFKDGSDRLTKEFLLFLFI